MYASAISSGLPFLTILPFSRRMARVQNLRTFSMEWVTRTTV